MTFGADIIAGFPTETDAMFDNALALVKDLGFDAQDFGPLQGARLLEAFAMTWIHMAGVRKTGRAWGFARSVSDGAKA